MLTPPLTEQPEATRESGFRIRAKQSRTVDQVLFQLAADQLRELRLYCFVEGSLPGTRLAGRLSRFDSVV